MPNELVRGPGKTQRNVENRLHITRKKRALNHIVISTAKIGIDEVAKVKELSIGWPSSNEFEGHGSQHPSIIPEINVLAISNEPVRLSHHSLGTPNAMPNIARTGTKISNQKACLGKISSLKEMSRE